jgi:hypothetical protein
VQTQNKLLQENGINVVLKVSREHGTKGGNKRMALAGNEFRLNDTGAVDNPSAFLEFVRQLG